MDNILNPITAYRKERKWSLSDLAAHAAGEHRVGRLFPGGDIPARCRSVQREHPGGAKRIAPVLTP